MIFKLQKSQQTEIDEARSNLEMLLKEWNDKAISNNVRAIREIKALDSTSYEEMRASLINAIRPILFQAESYVTEIIDGVLNQSAQPYQNYLKEYFKNALIGTARNNITKKTDSIYSPRMREFIHQEKKKGALGNYFFEFKTFELTAEPISATEFTLNSKTELVAKVQIDSDKSIKEVEKDEVGLASHLSEIDPKFHKFLQKLFLSNDTQKAHNDHIKAFYRLNYQLKAIGAISQVINSFSGRSTKKAA